MTSQTSDELPLAAETCMPSSQRAKGKKGMRERLRQLLLSTSQSRLSCHDSSPIGEEGPEVKSQSSQVSSGDVANENRAQTAVSVCIHTCAT